MGKKIQYLVIHTSDTPYDREVTPDDITLWHLGACKQSNGTYKFLGKTYTLSELKKQYLTLYFTNLDLIDIISNYICYNKNNN